MSYAVEFTRKAERQFFELPPPVGERVLDRIELLAKEPTLLSRPGGPAFRHSQIYQFWGEGEALNWWFSITFRYAQDEQTLVITTITFRHI